jgi:hypothetical protein
MQVQEAKSPVKILVRQRCAEGFNSSVKGLILQIEVKMQNTSLKLAHLKVKVPLTDPKGQTEVEV